MDSAQNGELSKLATLAELACEELKKDKGTVEYRPSIEWFRHAPNSPFKRGIPPQSRPTKRVKAENGNSVPVQSSCSNDDFECTSPYNPGEQVSSALPTREMPLHTQFLSSLALPKKYHSKNGCQRRSTAQERLEFFEDEAWAEVLSPTSVRCTACGKICQLDKRGSGTYHPWPWMMHRRICVRMYAVWLKERGKTDGVWFYRRKGGR
ncbi:hypothetical protein DFS33DRAFT_1377959 [Desarmillaria ectypa]|nr:hypothetical protein DFS33DRAFT_1377959 [Desarmillaria ectypa]